MVFDPTIIGVVKYVILLLSHFTNHFIIETGNLYLRIKLRYQNGDA